MVGDEPGLHRVAQGSQTGPRFPETGPFGGYDREPPLELVGYEATFYETSLRACDQSPGVIVSNDGMWLLDWFTRLWLSLFKSIRSPLILSSVAQ